MMPKYLPGVQVQLMKYPQQKNLVKEKEAKIDKPNYTVWGILMLIVMKTQIMRNIDTKKNKKKNNMVTKLITMLKKI